jgi:hypothetical protein
MTNGDNPPRIPETNEELDRAIVLLGSRAKTETTTKVRNELEALVGTYPTQAEAAVWKSRLKSIRKAMKE